MQSTGFTATTGGVSSQRNNNILFTLPWDSIAKGSVLFRLNQTINLSLCSYINIFYDSVVASHSFVGFSTVSNISSTTDLLSFVNSME